MTGATVSLLRRDLLRFVRQPSRIVAAVGTPILLLIVFGAGFAGSLVGPTQAEGDLPYAAYLIPGVATMVVLFSSIFAAISLIEDRNEGFLQSVLASPTPRATIAVSKVLSCALFGVAQSVLVLLAAPLLGMPMGPTGLLAAAAALLLIAFGISGVGVAAAWYVNSSQGFHGVMNLVLMPMWLLSGAVFPIATSAGWLSWAMRLNPLSWGTEVLRQACAGPAFQPFAPIWLLWVGAALFAAAGLALPAFVMRGGRTAHTR